MNLRRRFQFTVIAGIALFGTIAKISANPITFNTNAAGTVFAGDGLTLDSSTGASATLTYTPDADGTVGIPSNVNFGFFTLLCPSCTTQAMGTGSFFDSFTFDLIITDISDGATGLFVGSSTGGSVWSDVSQINITWVPLQLGPGTSNATTGNFASTIFTITSSTEIVAPNSGAQAGESTVQGHLDTAAAPEPATFGLIGGGLLALGIFRLKRLSGK